MKRPHIITAFLLALAAALSLLLTCCGDVNAVDDQRFTAEGELLCVDKDTLFKPVAPSRVHFYVEVSGSMNGFFRPGIATQFKADVWQIMSYYSELADSVTILTGDGTAGADLTLEQFRSMMNAGAFVSTASTRLPTMLRTIYRGLRARRGEVAVMISDMKYSPDGASSPEVLKAQYASDIADIVGGGRLPVALVGATSDYAGRTGQVACERSPYYYLIVGHGPQVASMRNGVSTMLAEKKHFIDNIECGFRYGAVRHTFGTPVGCWQLDKRQPTFCGYEPSENDTCTVRLNISLENYRWLVADTAQLRRALHVKALYGSKVGVGEIVVTVDNTADQELRRRATATVSLRLWAMPMDADVVEWGLTLPDTDFTRFTPYCHTDDPDDIARTYSLEQFIEGMFHAGQTNGTLRPNYILISKNS